MHLHCIVDCDRIASQRLQYFQMSWFPVPFIVLPVILFSVSRIFLNEFLVGFATEMLELKSYSGALTFNSCIHFFCHYHHRSFCCYKNLVFHFEFIRIFPMTVH